MAPCCSTRPLAPMPASMSSIRNMRRSRPRIRRSSGFQASSPTRSSRASRCTPSGRPPRRPSDDPGVKANANQIRAAIDAASPDIRLYLLHGPDESGAQEIAARLARTMGPDAERVDLEPSMLKSSPGRLADEAASLSLFGTARHIRIAGAGDECLEAVALLLETERAGNPVVAIAPSLKATSKLVKLAIGAPRAMSFACYLPEGGDAEKIAVAIAREQ